jgi:hypothetical protein
MGSVPVQCWWGGAQYTGDIPIRHAGPEYLPFERTPTGKQHPIHRPHGRFERRIGHFVALPLPGSDGLPNLHASKEGKGSAMKRGIRLIALSAAIVVNAAALFATHAAMVDAAERERLAQQDVASPNSGTEP